MLTAALTSRSWTVPQAPHSLIPAESAGFTDPVRDETFAPGQTSKMFRVKIIDDTINEGDETIAVALSNPSNATLADATATGTIENTDPMPKAWMVRFGRTVGSQIVDAVGARLDGGHETHVTVGGISLTGAGTETTGDTTRLGLPEWETERTLEPTTQTMTPGEILLGSSFSLCAGEVGSGSSAIGAWGHFATSQFEGTEEDVDHEGDVLTGLLGADIAWERPLAGIVLSHSTGDGGYTGEGAIAGDTESTLTGVYPNALSSVTYCTIVCEPVTNVLGAPARISSMSRSAIVMRSMPSDSSTSASSRVCADTCVIFTPVALLAWMSATVRLRLAGRPP